MYKKISGDGKIKNKVFAITEYNVSIMVELNEDDSFKYKGIVSNLNNNYINLNEFDKNDELLSFLNKLNDYIIFKYNSNKEEFQKIKVLIENSLI